MPDAASGSAASESAHDRVRRAAIEKVALAFEGEGEAWSDPESGDRLASVAVGALLAAGYINPDAGKLGLIGRDAVIIERFATSLHVVARTDHDHTPLRDLANRRGKWFEVRLADGYIARVSIVLDRIERVSDGGL